jgi:hypothetical protein
VVRGTRVGDPLGADGRRQPHSAHALTTAYGIPPATAAAVAVGGRAVVVTALRILGAITGPGTSDATVGLSATPTSPSSALATVTEPPKIILYYCLSLSTWPLSNNKELFCRFCWVKPGKSLTTGSRYALSPHEGGTRVQHYIT